jgi:signal peptidase
MTAAKVVKATSLIALCLALLIPAALIATGNAPYRVFVVQTGSMLPAIPPSSAVIVEKGVYRVGQAITFTTANGVVTHRLVARNSDGTLITKGDANATPDPGSISPSEVIGGVIAAPPMLGWLLSYLKNPLGIASLMLGGFCLWLALSMVRGKRAAPQQA